MCRGADAAHRIFDEDQLIASIVGGTYGGFDTEVGGGSAQDDRTDSSPASLLVELRTVKGAPLPLRDQQVAGLIPALGNELGSGGWRWRRIRIPAGRIDRKMERIGYINPNIDYGSTLCAELGSASSSWSIGSST